MAIWMGLRSGRGLIEALYQYLPEGNEEISKSFSLYSRYNDRDLNRPPQGYSSTVSAPHRPAWSKHLKTSG
jgi:hypothetical protein